MFEAIYWTQPSHTDIGRGQCVKKTLSSNAFGQARLCILFDPVVKDWSIERSHRDKTSIQCRGDGERL